MFGTGNLHTWAQSLNEFINRFTDTRKIDRSKFMDDSAYRYWEIYAQIPPQVKYRFVHLVIDRSSSHEKSNQIWPRSLKVLKYLLNG